MKIFCLLFILLGLKAFSQDSLVVTYYPNDSIKTEGRLIDKKREGQWTTYYSDGRIAEITNWKKGLMDTVQLRYYENGVIKEKAFVKNGEFIGYITLYYDNGKPKARTLYENGKPVPPYEFFNAEGKMTKSGPYESGYVYYYDVQTGEIKDSLIPKDQFVQPIWDLKPVIYLYPEVSMDVEVNLDYSGDFLFTYPSYEEGWKIHVQPDGSLTNISDNSQHYYLYWEGQNNNNVAKSFNELDGYVVKGGDVEKFLIEKFKEMNLTAKEYNDFIVFWLPRMINNDFNYVHFVFNEAYDAVSKMEINPRPNNVYRVYMVFKPLKEPIFVQPQDIPKANRDGFHVIEWGGTELPLLNN